MTNWDKKENTPCVKHTKEHLSGKKVKINKGSLVIIGGSVL